MPDMYFRKKMIEYAKSVGGTITTTDVHDWMKDRYYHVPSLRQISNYLARYVEFEHIVKNTYRLKVIE